MFGILKGIQGSAQHDEETRKLKTHRLSITGGRDAVGRVSHGEYLGLGVAYQKSNVVLSGFSIDPEASKVRGLDPIMKGLVSLGPFVPLMQQL